MKNISEEDYLEINKRSLVENGDVLFAMIGTIGNPVVVNTDKKFSIKNVALFKFRYNEVLYNKFLKYLLLTDFIKNQIDSEIKGSNRKFLSLTILRNLRVPLPPIEIQKKVVSKIEGIEEKENKIQERINELKDKIKDILPDTESITSEKLGNISNLLQRGKTPKYGNSNVQIIKSGQARGYKSFDFSIKHYVSEKFELDERELQKGDILINSTGVGTAGRVTLFELDGSFVVDTHITILRLNKEVALPKFILYSLAKIGFKTLEKMATGQSGQVELSLDIIKNIEIKLPAINVQAKVVEEINKLESEIEKFENDIVLLENQKNDVIKNEIV